jgi:hypothetical protein
MPPQEKTGMDNSVRPNLRYCIIIIKVKAIAEGSSEEGSSATDVTDVTDVRNEGCSATDSVTDVRKKEEGRRKKL